MICLSSDVGAALRSQRPPLRRSQRGFWTLPAGRGAARPGGSGAVSKRYWRVRRLYGLTTFLEISEIQFWTASARISGTMTSSHAPDFGSLSDENDNVLTTRCYWSAATAELTTFWVMLDCGSNVEVAGVRLGGFDTAGRYPANIAALEWSDDGSTGWTSVGAALGLSYPGNFTLSSLITFA